jgi:hypothetical protein
MDALPLPDVVLQTQLGGNVMRKQLLLPVLVVSILGLLTAAIASAAPTVKLTICHKYGTPDQATLTIGYPAVPPHIQNHGDFMGACPVFDTYIDVDGIATTGRGIPFGVNINVGDVLTFWPTGGWTEGLDWFDNDGSCTWTFGDDLHLEDASGACATGIRDGLHQVGADCDTLDLDGSFFMNQQVDVDLETGTVFTGCSGPDPLMGFFDQNGNGFYDDGEDIVLDVNANGVFD